MNEENRKVGVFENKRIQELLCISWTKYIKNENVFKLAGTTKKAMPNHIESHKLCYFGHII